MTLGWAAAPARGRGAPPGGAHWQAWPGEPRTAQTEAGSGLQWGAAQRRVEQGDTCEGFLLVMRPRLKKSNHGKTDFLGLGLLGDDEGG